MAVMWVNTQVKKERKTSLLQFPRGGRTTPCRGEHRGEAPGSARRQRVWGERGQKSLLRFLWEGMGKAG